MDPIIAHQILNFSMLCLQFLALDEITHSDDSSIPPEFLGLVVRFFTLCVMILDDLGDDFDVDRILPHRLLRYLASADQFVWRRRDVYTELAQNWETFWWLTGETPSSFESLHERLEIRLQRRINGRRVSNATINTRNRLLLALIWFRRYSTFAMLSFLFGISVSMVFQVLHFTVPILHVHLVPRFIRWPTDNEWHAQAGTYPNFPTVVGHIDGSCFRIMRPTGRLQRIFYRGDKKFHFVNWILVIDTNGLIVFSRTGFPGRMHDSLCYR